MAFCFVIFLFFVIYFTCYFCDVLNDVLCVCVEAVDFLSQVLDSPEQEAVRDAVRNLQDIGE